MALRFQGSAAAPDSSILVADLPGRADALLLGGDLDGYRELFAQADRIEDVHRAYWARRRLVEQGLAAVAQTPPRQLPMLLGALAGAALDALEGEPREPKLLNYAGVALYELWGLEGARSLFRAARRLDPQLREAERNLTATAQRRQLARRVRRRVPLHPDLPTLEGRARAIAAAAAPASGLSLSLCMIVRDEQEMLPRCLAAVAEAVDEIVIVDTGSVDDTIEIARSFGALVIEREWTGSFAEARNVSFDAAHGDWLMYLDADELLVQEDAALLRSLTQRTWREAFYLAETNYTGELQDGTAVTHNALRIFRNRPEYRFEGRLHEQIAKNLPGYLPERLETTSVRVEHYGYLGVVRGERNKSTRNIEILRMQQQEGPPTAFLHYNLGAEYAADDDPASALREFERAWELLESDPERDTYQFVPALVNRLVKALRACERPQEAIERADEGLARFPGFTDLVLEQAGASLALAQVERAIELLARCIELGDASREYTAVVGCGTYLPRIALAEVYLARGEAGLALEPLEHCLEAHPHFVGSVLPYANALLATGLEPERVVAEVGRRLPEMPAAARFMLGTALYEAGAKALAESEFRAVLARQPRSARARVALGEVLLAQRRYGEAATTAAMLDAQDPLAAIASRTELFARIAGGDRAGLREALARAASAGLPQAELELFQAWGEQAFAGGTDRRIAPQAMDLLARALEALLRVQDFEAFEGLVGLLERTPLGERDRRQLLAEMYLRRGYLASAAEEWMAICASEPDPWALIGLARVASARGMIPEALDFVRGALERDPGNEPARQLLAQLESTVGEDPVGEPAIAA